MRPSDNDIGRENREAEMYADAAQRALAVEAVTRWNALWSAVLRDTGPAGRRWSVLPLPPGFTFSMSSVPAAVSSSKLICEPLTGTNARRCMASFRS